MFSTGRVVPLASVMVGRMDAGSALRRVVIVLSSSSSKLHLGCQLSPLLRSVTMPLI